MEIASGHLDLAPLFPKNSSRSSHRSQDPTAPLSRTNPPLPSHLGSARYSNPHYSENDRTAYEHEPVSLIDKWSHHHNRSIAGDGSDGGQHGFSGDFSQPIRDTISPYHLPKYRTNDFQSASRIYDRIDPRDFQASQARNSSYRERSRNQTLNRDASQEKRHDERRRSSRTRSTDKRSPRKSTTEDLKSRGREVNKAKSTNIPPLAVKPIEITLSSDEGSTGVSPFSKPVPSTGTGSSPISTTPPPSPFDPKRDTIFYCTPCREILANTAAFEDHIAEPEHKRKTCVWREIRSILDDSSVQSLLSADSRPALSQPTVDGCKELIVGGDQVVEIANRKLQVAEQWICQLCSVLCDSRSELVAHLTGVEHLAAHVAERKPELIPPSAGSRDLWLDAVRAAARKLANAEGKGQMKSLARQRVVPLDCEDLEEITDRELMAGMEMFFSTAETSITDFVPNLEGKEVSSTDTAVIGNPGFEFLVDFHTGAPSPEGSIAFCLLCRATLMKNAKDHCFSSAHCHQLSKLLPAIGLTKGKVLVITRRLKGGEWAMPSSGKTQLVKIARTSELFIPLGAPIFEEIVQNLDLVAKATRSFETNVKAIHSRDFPPHYSSAKEREVKPQKRSSSRKLTDEPVPDNVPRKPVSQVSKVTTGPEVLPSRDAAAASSGKKVSSHFLRRKTKEDSSPKSAQVTSYPPILTPLVETMDPHPIREGRSLGHPKTRDDQRERQASKSRHERAGGSKSSHRHSSHSRERPPSSHGLQRPSHASQKRSAPYNGPAQLVSKKPRSSHSASRRFPSEIESRGRRANTLEHHELVRLETALKAIGVDLGRPLTNDDIETLKEQFGAGNIDRLIEQVCRSGGFSEPSALNPTDILSDEEGTSCFENLVVSRDRRSTNRRLVIRSGQTVSAPQAVQEPVPLMPEIAQSRKVLLQQRLRNAYGDPSLQRTTPTPPVVHGKSADEKVFDANRRGLVERLKKIRHQEVPGQPLEKEPARPPSASLMDRLERRLEQEEQFRLLQQRRARVEHEEHEKAFLEEAAVRAELEREENEIRLRLANPGNVDGNGRSCRDVPPNDLDSSLVQNPFESTTADPAPFGSFYGDSHRPSILGAAPVVAHQEHAEPPVVVRTGTQRTMANHAGDGISDSYGSSAMPPIDVKAQRPSFYPSAQEQFGYYGGGGEPGRSSKRYSSTVVDANRASYDQYQQTPQEMTYRSAAGSAGIAGNNPGMPSASDWFSTSLQSVLESNSYDAHHPSSQSPYQPNERGDTNIRRPLFSNVFF